jgi:hypothetical protein
VRAAGRLSGTIRSSPSPPVIVRTGNRARRCPAWRTPSLADVGQSLPETYHRARRVLGPPQMIQDARPQGHVTVSPPFRVASACQIERSIVSETGRTDPSTRATFTIPEWKLREVITA